MGHSKIKIMVSLIMTWIVGFPLTDKNFAILCYCPTFDISSEDFNTFLFFSFHCFIDYCGLKILICDLFW